MNTVTKIDLQRFVATDDDARTHLRAPWRNGQWVYATNGHVCVRVPVDAALEAAEATPAHPKAGNLFTKWIDERDGEFLVMPPLPAAEKCESCKGVGWHWAVKCPDCDDGTFQHGRHTYDCQECSGPDVENEVEPGWLVSAKEVATLKKTCWQCGGRGFEAHHRFELGAQGFDVGYLHWLAALPECRVRTGTGEDCAAFIFDGGQALLMPLRPQR